MKPSIRATQRFVLGVAVTMAVIGGAASFALDGWMTVVVLTAFALAISSAVRAYAFIGMLARFQERTGRGDVPGAERPSTPS